jgi:TRAP-type C4-dicarboxylate transport system permease small subunit
MNQPGNIQEQQRYEPRLVRLLDRITYVCYTISGLLLLLIMTVYLAEIFLRYVLGTPTVWSIDLVSYALAAMVSMAAPELARNNMHISISLVPDSIKNIRLRENYVRALTFFSAAVLGYVVYVTGGETYKLFQQDILTVGTFVVPKWWVSVFIPVGLFLTTAQYLRLTIYGLDSIPQPLSPEEGN